MLSPISVTPLARGLVFQRFHERLSSTASLQSWMNEHGEYFAIDETASSHQFPILLDNKGCPSFAAVCDFLVRMQSEVALGASAGISCVFATGLNLNFCRVKCIGLNRFAVGSSVSEKT
jgi:hypothetical protein